MVVILLIVNVLTIVFLLIRKAWSIFREKRYKTFEVRLRKEIEHSMMNDPPKLFLQKHLNKSKQSFIYRMLLELAAEKGENFHVLFDEAGFTQHKLKNLNKTQNLSTIKELSIIKSPLAYNALFELLGSSSSEVTYRSAYALSYIELTQSQQKEIIETLINTPIVIDRVIEIIEIINPPIEEYYALLKNQKSSRGKIILLHFLKNKIKNKETTYRYLQKIFLVESRKIILEVMPFIYDEDEVSIAAILVLEEINDMLALEIVLEKYRISSSESIKITIAKALRNFEPEKVIPVLRKMIEHDSWWVKFHAFESLLKLNKKGYDEILAISLDKDNPIQADLAQQMIDGSSTFRMLKRPGIINEEAVL